MVRSSVVLCNSYALYEEPFFVKRDNRDLHIHVIFYITGSYVLSNAMDNTLRVWDVRPFVTTDRCVKIITGHKHNFEKVLLFILKLSICLEIIPKLKLGS